MAVHHLLKILAHFLRAHLEGMAFVMEEDVGFDPTNVSLLGADAIVFETDQVADLVE